MAGTQRDINIRLDQIVNKIKSWKDECRKNHQAGCPTTGQSTYPRRLVEVLEGGNLRLITSPEEKPAFAALSYCWGEQGQDFFTRKSNLTQMTTQISRLDLFQTLQDFFVLAEKLEYQYCWIDSLCIVQDDDADKFEEISRMGYIFSNADLVIAATASNGAKEGMFCRETTVDPTQEQHDIMRSNRFLNNAKREKIIKARYPLLSRGWAFQERILARRIVHFTECEMVWECRNGRWCERAVLGKGFSMQGRVDNLLMCLNFCLTFPTPARSIAMWRECVEDNSKRNFSDPEDRVPSILGIATLLGGSLDQYVHGMRKDAMPFELLWQSDQSGQEVVRLFRPTWSWGSLDCGIKWPTAGGKESNAIASHVLRRMDFQDGLRGVGYEVNGNELTLMARVVSVQIVRFGTQLWITRLGEDSPESQSLPPYDEPYQDLQFDARRFLRFYPDMSPDGVGNENEQDFLVEVATGGSRVYGLVVQKTTNAGFIERVGVAGSLIDSEIMTWFDEEEGQEVVIV